MPWPKLVLVVGQARVVVVDLAAAAALVPVLSLFRTPFKAGI